MCERGCSSVGRASALQAEGRRFKSVHLHFDRMKVMEFVESRFPSSFTSQSGFFSHRDHRWQVFIHEGFANLLWQNVRKNFAKCGFDSLQGLESHAKTSAHVRHEAASEKLLEKLLTPLDEGNRRGYLSPLARE